MSISEALQPIEKSEVLSEGDIITSMRSLDTVIESLVGPFKKSNDHNNTEFRLRSNELAASLARISLLEEERQAQRIMPENLNMYYSLLSRAELSRETIASYILYSRAHHSATAKATLDGTSGMTITHLSSALDDYDQATEQGTVDELSGAIAELTFVSLANMKEDGEIFSFPAPVVADLHHRIDAYVMHRKTIGRIGHRALVQVKSVAPRLRSTSYAPTNGFTIYADEMQSWKGNDYATARNLVSLYAGGVLTPGESTQLEKAHGRFNSILSEKLRQNPGSQVR